jgi:alpha-L-fucosidase
MTMNDHWGYNSHDTAWKSVETLVRNLIDVASKGGNYLLNVGPKADGTFPDEAIERLKGIGAWMQKNGDAIHGTSASPFEALPWGRVTMKRNGADSILYLHVFERPADGKLVLPGLGSEPLSAGWLAGPRLALPVKREGTDVVVELPSSLPDSIASVVTLGIEGDPIVYRAPEIVAESDIFVRPLSVGITLQSPVLEVRYTLDRTDPTEASPRYDAAILLSETTEVRARAFHEGRAVSATTARVFSRVEPRLGRPVRPDSPGYERGLWVTRYHGDWDALPDFKDVPGGKPEFVTGVGPADGEEHCGLWFVGSLDIPSDDVYLFALSSDDGSDLRIDNELVVDNDGLHGTQEKRGRIALGKGLHLLSVRWFNKTGGAELDLMWSPLGGELRPIEEGLRSAAFRF